MVTRELHAKLVGYSAIQGHKNWGEAGLAGQHAPRATSEEGTGGPDGARNTGSTASNNKTGPQALVTQHTPLTARHQCGGRRRRPEHRWRNQRNTGGAAATRVCERPGGESPPPGLYTSLTFP